MKVKVLGLDLSLTCTGYCVIDENGNIIVKGIIETQNSTAKTKKRNVFEGDLKKRSLYIANTVTNLINNHDIKKIVIESPSFSSKGNATIDLGFLHGMVHSSIFLDTNLSISSTNYTAPQSLKKYAADKSGIIIRRNRETVNVTNPDGSLKKDKDEKVITKKVGNVKDDVILAAETFFGEGFAGEFSKSRGKGDVVDATWIAYKLWEETS